VSAKNFFEIFLEFGFACECGGWEEKVYGRKVVEYLIIRYNNF